MKNYDVIRQASKAQLAVILARLAAGLLDGDETTFAEVLPSMLEFLDEEA